MLDLNSIANCNLSLLGSPLRTSSCLVSMPSYFDFFVLGLNETNILGWHWNVRTEFQISYETSERTSTGHVEQELLAVPLGVWLYYNET